MVKSQFVDSSYPNKDNQTLDYGWKIFNMKINDDENLMVGTDLSGLVV
jgi:hypothetical protein